MFLVKTSWSWKRDGVCIREWGGKRNRGEIREGKEGEIREGKEWIFSYHKIIMDKLEKVE